MRALEKERRTHQSHPKKQLSGNNAGDSSETVPETIPETIPETTTAATSQQSVTWMITGFEPLKDEIMVQQLPLGSVETDIQFPDTLEVTMQKVRDAEDDVENDAADLEQNESAQESTEFAENDTIRK